MAILPLQSDSPHTRTPSYPDSQLLAPSHPRSIMGKVDVAPARLEMEDAAAVSSTAPESSTLAHPEGPAVKLHGRRRASLPGPIRFILIVILSLAFSSLGHSLITEWSQGELGSIARIPESDAETVLLTVWKVYVCSPLFRFVGA